MFTKEFWADALERAVKTAAQGAITLIGTTVYFHEVNWVMILSGILLITVLSILTSIAIGKTNDGVSASLVDTIKEKS